MNVENKVEKSCVLLIDLWNMINDNNEIQNYYDIIYHNINSFLKYNEINLKLDVYNVNSNKKRIQPNFLNYYKTIPVGNYLCDVHQYSDITAEYILNNYEKIYIMGLSLDECCMGNPLGYKRLKEKAFIVKNCVIQYIPSSDTRIKINAMEKLEKYINYFLTNGHKKHHPRENERLSPVIYEKINFIETWNNIV
tara:strand:+ start:19 stop:600 length:582 start_codon:yes stop_codon:yes gene_type:complete